MDNANLENIVFALLFSADEPLTMRKLTSILDGTPAADIGASIEGWRKRLDDEAWSIVIEKVAGGYQLSSRAEYAPYIARLYSGRRKMRLSKAALETLAIIAYKQPITRAQIEHVRGVACGGVITNLMERALIRITGKAKVLGAPFLYGTTHEFLEYLGLNSLKDLPSMEELEEMLEREESAVPEPAAADAVDEEGAAIERESETPDEEAVSVTSAARIGPELEEPYHRPVGGDDEPVSVEVEQTDSSGPGGGEDEEADADGKTQNE